MTTVTTQQAQTQFSEIAKMVTAENPVTITTQGQPELMLMRYEDAVEAMRIVAKQKLKQWFEERRNDLPQDVEQLSEAELFQLIEAEREAVYQKKQAKQKY